MERVSRRRAASNGCGASKYRTALLISLISFAALSATAIPATDKPKSDEPKLLSVFPLGGQRGTTVKALVRGNQLKGASAVWFDSGGFKAQLLSVEEVKDEPEGRLGLYSKKDDAPVYQAAIEVRVEAKTAVGVYSLRIVTPRGVSNALQFPVMDEPVVIETPGPHQSIDQAQSVTIPAIVNGKLAKPGQVDYYSFLAKQGQELRFEAVLAEKLDSRVVVEEEFAPELALYQAGGSWFNPHRSTRLLSEEERSSDLMPVNSEGTYRFNQDGQYFLQVSGLYGEGCRDCPYQIRITSRQGASKLEADVKPVETEWAERGFDRQLEGNWMTTLEDHTFRTGYKPNAEAAIAASDQGNSSKVNMDRELAHAPGSRKDPSIVLEGEPNDTAAQAQQISIPSVVEGTIGRPGDVDNFKFSVKAGEKLAFEIETPDAQPPQFNPLFTIVDSQGEEIFTNLHKVTSYFNDVAKVETRLKGIEPKAIYTFEHGGDYVLQVRDVTSRYGGPNFRYRILIRPQIPHVGEISLAGMDHINLVHGESEKLTITASYEEGFIGQVAFSFTGLPDGVQPFPATESDDAPPSKLVDENAGIILPKRQKTTIVLVARSNAAVTLQPALVQLHCQPIVDGKLGESWEVREIPVMVVEGAPQK